MGLLSGLLHGQARFFSGPSEVPLVGLPERQPYSGYRGKGGTRGPSGDKKGDLPLAIQSHRTSAIASREQLDKEEAVLSSQYRERAMTLSTSEFYDDPFVKEYAGKMADIEARKMYGEMYESAMEPYYIQVDDFSKEIRDKDAGGTEILIENKKGGYTRTRTNYNEYVRNIYEDVTREKSSVFNEKTGRYEYKSPTQKPILAVDESGQFMQTINDLMDDAQRAESTSGGKIRYTNKQMSENPMLRFMQLEYKVTSNLKALGNMTDDVWDQLADKSVKKDAYRSYFNAVDEGYEFKESMVKKYVEAHGKKIDDITEDDYVKMYAFDMALGNTGGREVYGYNTTEKFDTGLYGATQDLDKINFEAAVPQNMEYLTQKGDINVMPFMGETTKYTGTSYAGITKAGAGKFETVKEPVSYPIWETSSNHHYLNEINKSFRSVNTEGEMVLRKTTDELSRKGFVLRNGQAVPPGALGGMVIGMENRHVAIPKLKTVNGVLTDDLDYEINLTTGNPVMTTHPLTGEKIKGVHYNPAKCYYVVVNENEVENFGESGGGIWVQEKNTGKWIKREVEASMGGAFVRGWHALWDDEPDAYLKEHLGAKRVKEMNINIFGVSSEDWVIPVMVPVSEEDIYYSPDKGRPTEYTKGLYDKFNQLHTSSALYGNKIQEYLKKHSEESVVPSMDEVVKGGFSSTATTPNEETIVKGGMSVKLDHVNRKAYNVVTMEELNYEDYK